MGVPVTLTGGTRLGNVRVRHPVLADDRMCIGIVGDAVARSHERLWRAQRGSA